MNHFPPAPECMSYGKVKLFFDRLTEGDIARGFVPGYHFKILNGDSVEVGHFNYRIGDTEHVRCAAGHIGYEILEQYRGHGYAGDACLAAAQWIAEVSEKVSQETLVTTDPDNIASIRTIERIGATFIDEVAVPEGDPHFLRGSYSKRRYRWVLMK
ncbi:MAG: GNAT family N-acetyltransferase [Akkermansiaceae bacterium]